MHFHLFLQKIPFANCKVCREVANALLNVRNELALLCLIPIGDHQRECLWLVYDDLNGTLQLILMIYHR
jgi:hypothetical protein